MCASGSDPPSCCCVQTLGLPAGNGIFKRGRPEPERQNAPYLLADSSHARSRSRSAPPRRHVASQPGRAPRSSAGPAPASRFPASYTALAITGGRGRGEAWVRYRARARGGYPVSERSSIGIRRGHLRSCAVETGGYWQYVSARRGAEHAREHPLPESLREGER
jgi:hypothetical protein